MSNQHPMQPVRIDDGGTVRFKENAIVRWLLDSGRVDMNFIAVTPFSDEDREQFAQLIGYSVSGFGELSYAGDGAIREADELAAKALKESEVRDE